MSDVPAMLLEISTEPEPLQMMPSPSDSVATLMLDVLPAITIPLLMPSDPGPVTDPLLIRVREFMSVGALTFCAPLNEALFRTLAPDVMLVAYSLAVSWRTPLVAS